MQVRVLPEAPNYVDCKHENLWPVGLHGVDTCLSRRIFRGDRYPYGSPVLWKVGRVVMHRIANPPSRNGRTGSSPVPSATILGESCGVQPLTLKQQNKTVSRIILEELAESA